MVETSTDVAVEPRTSDQSSQPRVVGVVGGGQLARMMQPAAVALGVQLRLLAQSVDESASQVIPDVVLGSHTDLDALRTLASEADVLTFDHEHVPTQHLEALEGAGRPVRPGPAALVHAQDKSIMRARLAELGVPCPAAAVVHTASEVSAFAERTGWPVVLKTPRGGYDGKCVWVVRSEREAADLLQETGSDPLLAEQHVDFRRELSAQVARSPLGQAVAYPVVETVQIDGICREVIAPAPGLDADLAVTAQHIALTIAHELGVTGMLAVELFETAEGVLVNELAMRPHNSGHWTIDGAVTSQFEQHLRAVLDLPLGSPRTLAPYAVMINVLGGSRRDLRSGLVHVMARDPGLRVHLYGKEVKPGRKVGHVTVVDDDLDDLLERGRHAADHLSNDHE